MEAAALVGLASGVGRAAGVGVGEGWGVGVLTARGGRAMIPESSTGPCAAGVLGVDEGFGGSWKSCTACAASGAAPSNGASATASANRIGRITVMVDWMK
ncbi:hypothetical protein [Altererythrobacter sp. MF3-039]|uniref:hypothetical protein n=1 Tax=Altererythrobacter sp. MF3-039 TaxID=3252901 RepID=UPI00390C71BC